MADANKDERTLVMKQESGEDITYQVSEMSPEAQLIYSKIEILSKESQNTKVSAEFKLEQNQILQSHYLEALKPLIETLPVPLAVKLRSILEAVLLDTMYDLPSSETISKVVVDEGVINGESEPMLIYEGGDQAKAVPKE